MRILSTELFDSTRLAWTDFHSNEPFLGGGPISIDQRAAYPLPALNNFDFEVHNDGALFQQRFLDDHEKPLRKCGPAPPPVLFQADSPPIT